MDKRSIKDLLDEPGSKSFREWLAIVDALREARAVLKGIAPQSLEGATPEEAATDVLKKWGET